MKGFCHRAMMALACGTALAAGQGCYSYRNLVDPCYPERYQYMARQEVNAAFGPQVNNGRVLEQTVWNYHFENGTDKLTPGGLAHLAFLTRRRPSPDGVVYLQTAQDLRYDQENPEKLSTARQELDSKRIAAVQKYLSAQTAGRPMSFQVVLHDPPEVGLGAEAMRTSVQQMNASSQGVLIGVGGATTGGSGTSSGQ